MTLENMKYMKDEKKTIVQNIFDDSIQNCRFQFE
jgi:hypothetical protein